MVDLQFSNPSGIKFGIPQGSVIGLILLLIYINNLINAVENLKPTIWCCLCQPVSVTNCDRSSSLPNVLIAFADDSTLGTSGRTESDVRSKMISLFERVIQCLNVNYLALSVEMSCFLIFSESQKLALT